MGIYQFPTAAIIEKWYLKLNFPKKYDDEFYGALRTLEISPSTSIEDYDLKESDGKKNLLSFLYMCDALERKYKEKGIDRTILMDTLGDLVRWTEIWSELKGELYLGQLTWVSIPMKMQIFKLGRLQFCMQNCDWDVPKYKISAGDPILGIHIPAGAPMTPESCQASLCMAKDFFRTYYPEYKYSAFTCHSWLLDTTLINFLPVESNILAFQKLFDIVGADVSDDIIHYVFRWEANREDIARLPATSNFSLRVREHLLAGGAFYAGLGVIPNDA